MKLNVLRTVFGAALVGAVFSAQAVTLNLSGYAANSVPASSSTPAFSTGAGAFVGSLSNAPGFDSNPFYTYCVELTQSFNSWGSQPNYSVVDGATYFAGKSKAPAGTIVERLGKLFTSLGGVNLPTSAAYSAAIQLAVWESIYEGTAAAVLSLNDASSLFSVTSPAAGDANTLLVDAAAVGRSLYSISVLQNDTHQDFLLVQRVPEPASLALVGLALAGLAYTRRRRA